MAVGDIWARQTRPGETKLRMQVSFSLILTYPDKNERLGVADPVLSLGNSDHGELGRAGANGH